MRSLILILFTFQIFFGQKAYSCQCKEYARDTLYQISYELADIVFLGELINSEDEFSYKFKIYEVFKGEYTCDTITYKPMTNCSLYPYPGGLWLIYANFTQGDIIDIDGCLASINLTNPLIFPPPPPIPEGDNGEITLEQEIEQLKLDIKRERLQREAITRLYAEIEKLRYLKKKSTANKL